MTQSMTQSMNGTSTSQLLTTYAHDPATVRTAIAAGADHLIIDDPRLSIRCWLDPQQPQYNTDDFTYLSELAAAARFERSDIRLTLNVDKLCRDHQLHLIHAAFTAAAKAGFDGIRVLDGGLIGSLKKLAPDLRYELATEMGNCCFTSVSAYAEEGFDHIVLSNDWPAADIAELSAAIAAGTVPKVSLETLVHGPVLLQYSDRRQLSAGILRKSAAAPDVSVDSTTADTLAGTTWRSVDVDQRPYPFADNQHGAFMYNTFDRSVYNSAELLLSAGLSGWLIDARAQSTAYLQTALHGFAYLRATGASAPEHWQAMRDSGERSFKPGFFHANNTDHCFEDIATDHAEHDSFGEVIDVQRGEKITILLHATLPDDCTDILLYSPEGKILELDFAAITDAVDQPLTQPQGGDVIRLPWVKGSVPASILRKSLSNE